MNFEWGIPKRGKFKSPQKQIILIYLRCCRLLWIFPLLIREFQNIFPAYYPHHNNIITLPGMRLLIFVLHNIYLNIFEGQHSFSPIFTEKYLFSKNDVSFFLCCWIVFDLCEFYSFYTLNFGKYVSHFFILSVLLRSGWNNMIKLTKKRLNCKFLSHIFLEMLKSRFLESPPIKYITLFRGCL